MKAVFETGFGLAYIRCLPLSALTEDQWRLLNSELPKEFILLNSLEIPRPYMGATTIMIDKKKGIMAIVSCDPSKVSTLPIPLNLPTPRVFKSRKSAGKWEGNREPLPIIIGTIEIENITFRIAEVPILDISNVPVLSLDRMNLNLSDLEELPLDLTGYDCRPVLIEKDARLMEQYPSPDERLCITGCEATYLALRELGAPLAGLYYYPAQDCVRV